MGDRTRAPRKESGVWGGGEICRQEGQRVWVVISMVSSGGRLGLAGGGGW